MPELTEHLAAALAEGLAEAAALLMAESVVLADGGNLLVALLQRPVGERPGEVAGRVAGNAHDVLDPLALGQVVRGDDRDEIGYAVALDVIGDGEAGIGEQIAEEHIHIRLLDEPARLLQRGIRIGGIVLDGDLDLAAGDLVPALLP